MALEFICDKSLESKRIIIPRSANIYKINFSSKMISFYYDNPGTVDLWTWRLPSGAREMDFLRSDKKACYVVIPRFYDKKGKILKIGNR